MADIGIGALGYVGFGREVSEGGQVSPAHFIPANSADFPDNNDYLTPLQIRGTRDIVVAMPAPYNVSGTVEFDLINTDIGTILQSAFAATVSTSAYAGGGYTHVFAPGNTSPTMSWEKSAQNELIMRYTGVRVNTLEIKGSFGEIVTASLGLDGIDRAQIAKLSAATPSYAASSVYPFHFNGAKVQIAGVDSGVVKDFTFGVNNNVSHIGTLRKTRAYKRVAMGARELTLSMSLDFYDDTEYARLLGDTEFAVTLILDGPNLIGAAGANPVSLTIALPRVKYKTVGLPINAGDFLTQDVQCTVLKPVAADICTVTLSNAETNATLLG